MFKKISFSALTLAGFLTTSAIAQTEQPLAAYPSSGVVADVAGGQIDRQITTIDELVRTGQLRRTVKEIQKIPPTLPQTTARAAAPRALGDDLSAPANTATDDHFESALQLLTTFEAVGLRRAQLRVSGHVILVDLGDRIKGGWYVSDIASVSVHLERCIKKKCEEKILHLGED